MKLTCENANYCATVVKIHNLINLEGLDNLVGYPVFGFQALLSKDHNVGELGVVFTAETQLSPDFCRENNLYRDAELNKDKEQTGYIDPKGRIRTLKLRGNISSALFMPVTSLSYLGVNPEDFKEGDTFTHINGVEVCRKYQIVYPQKGKSNKIKGQTRKKTVDEQIFKPHVETEHFLRNLKEFKNDDWIIVTEKIHSTSGRFGHIQIDRELKWYEKLAKFFGIKVQGKEWAKIAGSRRAIKTNNKNAQHFYQSDVWTDTLEKIQHLIPKNVMIYGEIVGWDGDSPLQKDYTYQIPKGQTDFYVYRIASVNEDGFMIDWDWEQIKTFCMNTGIKHCPEVFSGYFKDFDYTYYEDKKFREDLGLKQCLALDDGAPCSEGLVLRKRDGKQIPYLTKFKSPEFYLHEGHEISCGRMDMETLESV